MLLACAPVCAQVTPVRAVASPAPAQPSSGSAPAESPDPAIILLDPAHGGNDNGVRLGADALEKDVTLAFANRLRVLLAARGFKVIMTRTTAADNASTDERIDLAEHTRPATCLLLHASSGGHGVHLYSSALTAATPAVKSRDESDGAILPWDTTQARFIAASLDLQSDLAAALNGIEIPLVSGRASVSPIDSLRCAAVAIELAPYTPDGGTLLEPSSAAYQATVAKAIADAIVFRRQHGASGKSSASRAAAGMKTPLQRKVGSPEVHHPARPASQSAAPEVHPRAAHP